MASSCSPGLFQTPSLPGALVTALDAVLVQSYTSTANSVLYYGHPTVAVENVTFCNVTVTYTHLDAGDEGIRDRNLQQDINRLEHVLSSLLDQDAAAAQEHLAPLIDKEQEWKRHDLIRWYRAVDKRIQHKEFSLALDDVAQYLDDLRVELNTPVWETPSRWGSIRPPLHQDDDDDWVTEEEGSELELSDDEHLPETSKDQLSEDDLKAYISETDTEGIESEPDN
ncbi:hypothetical protein NM208_g7263 [Fusarium decemcellulare]|uniref:Uncharacterized protein n=1 Tax=Fusarium decemcellulare TaxID=57161 RepID=A0ACC1SA33_9HYPO|nr:hypothetical protein NM208_g7263 [Fusarium decemcellulare]